MRQQRQLFRVFPEPEQQETSDASSVYFHSELLIPSSSLRDSSAHLHPTMQLGQYAGFPNLANLQSSNVLMHTDGYKCDDESDVDTSLHL
ncbi:hypothetical protein LINGRAHAP2_LOCUS29321 [Linum grandiflorum]